jgi:hypothetical protein
MGCFTSLSLVIGAVFVLLSLVRWFEQITEAVEARWWNKTALLLACPFAVWLFPSRVSAGRPTAVPRHEPVRGFGVAPQRGAPEDSIPIAKTASDVAEPSRAPQAAATASQTDGPPPGTPPEFIGLPKIPPKKLKGASPAVDPEKIAKLRQKMREQGMLGDQE